MDISVTFSLCRRISIWPLTQACTLKVTHPSIIATDQWNTASHKQHLSHQWEISCHSKVSEGVGGGGVSVRPCCFKRVIKSVASVDAYLTRAAG